jgi:signal transduction histidine kinase
MPEGGGVYPIGLAVSAFLCGLIAVFTWQNREEEGVFSFSIVAMAFTVWAALMSLLLSGIGTHRVQSLLFGTTIAVAAVTGGGWFVFSLAYTGHSHWLRTEVWALLGVVSVGLLAVLVTNPIHGNLYWVESGSNQAVDYGVGPWYWVFLTPYLLTTAIGAGLCFLQSKRSRNVYRKVNFVNGFGALSLMIAMIADVSGITPTPIYVDSPLLMGFWSFVGIITFHTTLVYRLLPLDRIIAWLRPGSDSLVPLGRDYIIENIEDGLVVVNEEGRIVDLNDTAKGILGKSSIGKLLTEVDEFEGLLREGDDVTALGNTAGRLWLEDDRERCFDLTVSRLRTDSDSTAGYVLLMRDVTEVKEREEELGLLKDTMSRFLRHNIRNEMNLARSKVELIADDDYDTLDTEETVTEVLDVMDKIVERSDKARYVERIVEESGERVPIDIGEELAALQRQFQNVHSDIQLTVEVEPGTEVLASPHIDRAFENLVENAIEHNAGHARIRVWSRIEDDRVEILVEDNGPGIDEYEIDVLREGRETALEHGSGFGLWLVRWIVDRSDGSLSFEVTDHGTVASVTLDGVASTIDASESDDQPETLREALPDGGT